MKKILMSAVAVVVLASVVKADLSVNFKNTQAGVQDSGSFIADGSIAQLIWSSAGITTSAGGSYDVSGGKVLAGEFLLGQLSTTSGFGFFGPQGFLSTNSDVGGANINSGFFFTRVFSGSGAVGAQFVDVNQVDASGYVYDAQNLSSTYDQNALGLSAGQVVSVDRNVAVPEPGTMGLVGAAFAGLMFVRRTFRV